MVFAVVIVIVVVLGYLLLHLALPLPHVHEWVRKTDHPPLRRECHCGAVEIYPIQPPWEYFTENKVYLCPSCGDIKPRSWKVCSGCKEPQEARR